MKVFSIKFHENPSCADRRSDKNEGSNRQFFGFNENAPKKCKADCEEIISQKKGDRNLKRLQVAAEVHAEDNITSKAETKGE